MERWGEVLAMRRQMVVAKGGLGYRQRRGVRWKELGRWCACRCGHTAVLRMRGTRVGGGACFSEAGGEIRGRVLQVLTS